MKQEIEKYLESERRLNEQTIHNRELAIKFIKWLIIIGIAILIITIVGVTFFI